MTDWRASSWLSTEVVNWSNKMMLMDSGLDESALVNVFGGRLRA
jgi:hypothetical protein